MTRSDETLSRAGDEGEQDIPVQGEDASLLQRARALGYQVIALDAVAGGRYAVVPLGKSVLGNDLAALLARLVTRQGATRSHPRSQRRRRGRGGRPTSPDERGVGQTGDELARRFVRASGLTRSSLRRLRVQDIVLHPETGQVTIRVVKRRLDSVHEYMVPALSGKEQDVLIVLGGKTTGDRVFSTLPARKTLAPLRLTYARALYKERAGLHRRGALAEEEDPMQFVTYALCLPPHRVNTVRKYYVGVPPLRPEETRRPAAPVSPCEPEGAL